MHPSFLTLIVLGIIAYLVYRIFRHLVPATPPAAGTTTPTATPFNWNKVWKFLAFIGAVAGIFFLLSLAYAMLKNGRIGHGDSTTQTVDVRDNYGVIQQNDIHVTNIVQPTKKQVGQSQNRKTKQVVTQKGNTAPKMSFKEYLDTNEDPPAISASMEKDADFDPKMLR
jgi:hypothetical protein